MPGTVRLSLFVLAALCIAACSPQPAATSTAATPLDSDRARASYMVGLDLAQNLTPLRDEVDLETVILALRSAHAKEPSLLTTEQVDATRKQFTQHLREVREVQRKALAASNLAKATEFLARNGKRSEVHSTASGLQYEVLTAAEGTPPQATDTVRVHYIGRHLNGDEFENTYATDHSAEFVLNQVMPGWIEGIGLMAPGAKFRMWLPASVAFGEQGLSDQIEPNETVVYDVELLEIAGRP